LVPLLKVKASSLSCLQVVESGTKNIEVAVLRRGEELQIVSEDKIEALVKVIEAEKAAAPEEQRYVSREDADDD